MSVVPPIGATVPPRIVIVGSPSPIVRLSMWMVAQLGTLVPHALWSVPFRPPIVPAHTSLKSLSDAFVGALDATVPT
jgi:hypothetical protein